MAFMGDSGDDSYLGEHDKEPPDRKDIIWQWLVLGLFVLHHKYLGRCYLRLPECQSLALGRSSVAFLYDGGRLRPEQTPGETQPNKLLSRRLAGKSTLPISPVEAR